MTAQTTPAEFRSVEDFLDEIEPDARTIFREALIFARRGIRIDRKVWGRRRSSLGSIAVEAVCEARERDRSRRWNKACAAWRAQFTPEELEARQIKTRLAVIDGGYRTRAEREYLSHERNCLIARLNQLCPEYAEAAE